MPLLKGKSNVGHNIEVEEAHGKPRKQAVAIALNKAGVPKAKDEILPVGGDRERAVALKKHELGLTKSQDKATAHYEAGVWQARTSNRERLDKIRATLERQGYVPDYAMDLENGSIAHVYRNPKTKAVMIIYEGRRGGHAVADSAPSEPVTGFEKGGGTAARSCSRCAYMAKDSGCDQPVMVKRSEQPRNAEGLPIVHEHDVCKFFKEAGKAEDADAHIGMLGASVDKLRALQKSLERNGFEYRFPTAPPTAEMVSHGFRRGDEWRTLNERKNGYHNITGGTLTRAKDVMPVPIKTSNLVPLPSGEHNEVSYAVPRRAKDAESAWRLLSAGQRLEERGLLKTASKTFSEAVSAAVEEKDEEARREATAAVARIRHKQAGTFHAEDAVDRKCAADASAALPIQVSGSDHKDQLLRAKQYEIGGDRARALDSYRAAASEYRRANDRAGEAEAREGIEACQSKFAAQYDHPSKGRVKVCDSASVALRTAVERTRAGERVQLVGNKVLPGRARVGDSFTEVLLPKNHEFRPSSNDPDACSVCRLPKSEHKKSAKDADERTELNELESKAKKEKLSNVEHARMLILRGKLGHGRDEHEGFAKLEHSLAHEKGVTDPKAVAAAIGRKKYGAAGMARKAAAGRAKDGPLVEPMGGKFIIVENGRRVSALFNTREAASLALQHLQSCVPLHLADKEVASRAKDDTTEQAARYNCVRAERAIRRGLITEGTVYAQRAVQQARQLGHTVILARAEELLKRAKEA